MSLDLEIPESLLIWLALGAGVAALQMRKGQASFGLGLAYFLSLSVNHWVGPLSYLGDPESPESWLTRRGLEISLLGGLGLLLGLAAASRAHRIPPPTHVSQEGADKIGVMLATGIGAHTLLVSGFRFPTLTAIVSAASSLLLAGLCAQCYRAWFGGRFPTFRLWLVISMGFPMFTVLTLGFLGYGSLALLTVVATVARYYQPRWRVAAAGVVLFWFGLSVFVTYMRDRPMIREAVWGGASYDERLERLGRTLSDFEWFSLQEPAHRARINERLNQNTLVGAAERFIESGEATFARGSTFQEAVIAVVPRALWPGKPVTAGSGDLVTRFTGMVFGEGTSVGIGQVMEFFVNFGRPGVVIGFFVTGFLVGLLDVRAVSSLAEGDVFGFARWFLIAIALLGVGGSLVEAVGTSAGSLVAVLGIQFVLDREGLARSLRFGTRERRAPAVVAA